MEYFVTKVRTMQNREWSAVFPEAISIHHSLLLRPLLIHWYVISNTVSGLIQSVHQYVVIYEY